MLKGIMANGVNTWFQKGDVVEIKTVNEKSGLVLCYNKKHKKNTFFSPYQKKCVFLHQILKQKTN